MRVAEQLPDRLADRLPENIPKRNLDRADGGVQYRPAAPAGPAKHGLPVHLDLGGIAAHQIAFVLENRLLDGGRLAGDGTFAEARDALVGEDLDEHIVLRAAGVDDKRLQAGDL